MRNKFSVRIFSHLITIAILTTGLGEGAFAACYTPDKQLPAQTISDFLSNSEALLGKPENAQGGTSLSSTIRDLVASSPSTLGAVIALLKTASPAQQQAIGTGLGQAANFCNGGPDANFAADIQEQLAKSGSSTAKTSYASVTGNPIGSVAGGGAGGGVSGGSVGGSTSPSSITSSGTSTASPSLATLGTTTTGTNYFTGGITGASSAGSSVSK